MGRGSFIALGASLVVILAGAPVATQERQAGLAESVTLTRWEYLDLCYKSMSCGMRCGSEPALLYCETHILHTPDGGIAEFAYWWKASTLPAKDLRSKLASVNSRLPDLFRQSLPVVQGFWPDGPLENRLLIVHINGDTGEVIGMSCGGRVAYEPKEMAEVDQGIRDRGAIPIY